MPKVRQSNLLSTYTGNLQHLEAVTDVLFPDFGNALPTLMFQILYEFVYFIDCHGRILESHLLANRIVHGYVIAEEGCFDHRLFSLYDPAQTIIQWSESNEK